MDIDTLFRNWELVAEGEDLMELRRDAARYKYLRDSANQTIRVEQYRYPWRRLSGEDLDEEVDRRME